MRAPVSSSRTVQQKRSLFGIPVTTAEPDPTAPWQRAVRFFYASVIVGCTLLEYEALEHWYHRYKHGKTSPAPFRFTSTYDQTGVFQPHKAPEDWVPPSKK